MVWDSIPRLIVRHLGVDVPKGTKRGTCIFCGKQVDDGFDVELPDTFTSFERLCVGDVICPYCNYMLRTPDFRRKNWVVTESYFKFLSRSEALEILLDPPNEPWIMYITKSKRKHGWIWLIEKMNESRDAYYVGYDEFSMYVVRSELEELYNIVVELRKLKISKQEILTGNFSVNSMRKIDDMNIIRKLLGWTDSPHLDLLLYLVK